MKRGALSCALLLRSGVLSLKTPAQQGSKKESGEESWREKNRGHHLALIRTHPRFSHHPSCLRKDATEEKGKQGQSRIQMTMSGESQALKPDQRSWDFVQWWLGCSTHCQTVLNVYRASRGAWKTSTR